MNDTVLIVGAGPTGLALAAHLAIHDVAVRVIDAGDGPVPTSRALGLQPRGREVLERIGALGDLPKRSRNLLNMYYNEGPRTVLHLAVGKAVASLPKQTLLVSQNEVETAIRTRLAELGVAVEWSSRLTAAEQTADGVVATVACPDGERQVRTDWLVGCDGAHSTVRKLAGIGFPGRKLIDRLLMIDVHADWPYDKDGSTTWMTGPGESGGGMLSVTALPDDRWRVFSEAGNDVPEGLTADEITERVLTEFTGRSGMSRDKAGQVEWASEFRIHRRLADTYRRGRMFLAGDSAHIQSPTGGQGQNTGLGDAENLAWKLALVAQGRADTRLLDTYEGERRPLAQAVLKATSSAVSIMLPATKWQRFLRDRVVMPAMRLSAVQRRVWLVASQLGISYRGGPLARGVHRWSRRPRPGDRMPDIACRRPDGSVVALHTAVDGCWTVLAADRAEGERHAAAAAGVLGARMVRVLVPERPHNRRQVVLVRPDGHVAWRGKSDPARLSAWLNKVLWPV